MADYDDPFAEPGDTDKTVIKPNPGGRRTATPVQQPETPQVQPGAEQTAAPAETGLDAYGVPQAAAPKPQAAAGGAKAPKMALTGMNQLTACASTLFALISRIRNRAQHMADFPDIFLARHQDGEVLVGGKFLLQHLQRHQVAGNFRARLIDMLFPRLQIGWAPAPEASGTCGRVRLCW